MILINPFISFADTPILSEPSATQEQIVEWLEDKNVDEEIIELVPYIYEEAEKAGVNPVLVICQSALETGYFNSYTFKHYHNTAGIKDRSNTNVYQYYDNYEEGFKSQIGHLALYAGNHQDWYYYSSHLDGWCLTIEELGGKWAEDPNYSGKVLYLMSQIENEPVEENIIEEKENVLEEAVGNSTEKKSAKDIIYDILNRNKTKSKGYEIISKYLK